MKRERLSWTMALMMVTVPCHIYLQADSNNQAVTGIDSLIIKEYKGQITEELFIKYDKGSKEIITVKKDGRIVAATDQQLYHVKLMEVLRKQEELGQKDKELAVSREKQEQEQERFQKALSAINARLLQKGYHTVNVPFKILFKDFWKFRFSNKIYLGEEKLSAELTEELLGIYKSTLGEENAAKTILINLPHGLEDRDIIIETF